MGRGAGWACGCGCSCGAETGAWMGAKFGSNAGFRGRVCAAVLGWYVGALIKGVGDVYGAVMSVRFMARLRSITLELSMGKMARCEDAIGCGSLALLWRDWVGIGGSMAGAARVEDASDGGDESVRRSGALADFAILRARLRSAAVVAASCAAVEVGRSDAFIVGFFSSVGRTMVDKVCGPVFVDDAMNADMGKYRGSTSMSCRF